MIIRFFDKDGKSHKLNLRNKAQLYIASEIGNTGQYSEIRLEEHTRFNKLTGQYETSGCFDISATSESATPLGITPSYRTGEMIIGPVKQM